jgi:hypothetical protein
VDAGGGRLASGDREAGGSVASRVRDADGSMTSRDGSGLAAEDGTSSPPTQPAPTTRLVSAAANLATRLPAIIETLPV